MEFRIADSFRLRLYPEGQIPELLFVAGYEPTELSFCARFLKPGMNVLDIGANVGLYSVLISHKIAPRGRAWCFEPSSQTAANLRRNLELNGCSNAIVVQKALSNADGGFLTLRQDPGLGDGERYILVDNRNNDQAGMLERVPITTLDAWHREPACDADHFDFAKMDVEGWEYHVLHGAKEFLAANPDIVLMFECTREGCARAGHRQQDVFDFLKALGYEIYCYDRKRGKWTSNEEMLLAAGNVWASRDAGRLPRV